MNTPVATPARDPAHEEAFVRSFILLAKRERYIALLSNPGRRWDILELLYHRLDTIPGRTSRIPPPLHNAAHVIATLLAMGSGPICYLISPDSDLDQHVMPLEQAVRTLIDEDRCAAVCCLPGRLAYWNSEEGGYLLHLMGGHDGNG